MHTASRTSYVIISRVLKMAGVLRFANLKVKDTGFADLHQMSMIKLYLQVYFICRVCAKMQTVKSYNVNNM